MVCEAVAGNSDTLPSIAVTRANILHIVWQQEQGSENEYSIARLRPIRPRRCVAASRLSSPLSPKSLSRARCLKPAPTRSSRLWRFSHMRLAGTQRSEPAGRGSLESFTLAI